MRTGIEVIFAVAAYLSLTAAECPNACSAHGKCGAYDMCTCYRNWMSNDCSERVCQFGLAHVDTPKGDLDSSSGALSGPGTIVIPNSEVYPCGTTEQYPAATDQSGLNVYDNYAHEYRECSNKGICDRGTGTCACFEGYDGSACQRASCPSNGDGVCSGHGTCQSIQEIAEADFNNVYRLWDEHSTMGCVCDGGYTGPDCSQRMCKTGADPLYFDEVSTARYSNFTYQFYTQGSAARLTGNYSLVFTDALNQKYTTQPIHYNASCAVVQEALESLPNKVIPVNSVRCFKSDQPNGYGDGQEVGVGVEPIRDTNMFILVKFTIAFPGNPGKLEQLAINTMLDGTRPTLFSDEAVSTLGSQVYSNGFKGEDVDMVPDYCEGVIVNLGRDLVGTGATHYLTGIDTQEAKALKRCLGDSDGNEANNEGTEVYDWDYGSYLNPHLIKLVDATQYYSNNDEATDGISCDNDCSMDEILKKFPSSQLCDNSEGNKAKFGVDAHGVGYCSNLNPPGFYAVLIYDTGISATNPFRLYTRAAQDYPNSAGGYATPFFVFTTKGYLNLVSEHSAAFTQTEAWSNSVKVKSHYTNVVHLSNDSTGLNFLDKYAGAIDCETNPAGTNEARDCLNKNDWVMFIANKFTDASTVRHLAANPVYPNLYQVKKIFRAQKKYNPDFAYPSIPNSEILRHQIHLDGSMNAKYSWNGGANDPQNLDTSAQVYKFYPPKNNADGGYRYVGPCSNRGICNHGTGLCECFKGYTSDNCGTINALAQ